MTMYQLYPEPSKEQTTLGEAISDVVNEDEEELKFLKDDLGPDKATVQKLYKNAI